MAETKTETFVGRRGCWLGDGGLIVPGSGSKLLLFDRSSYIKAIFWVPRAIPRHSLSCNISTDSQNGRLKTAQKLHRETRKKEERFMYGHEGRGVAVDGMEHFMNELQIRSVAAEGFTDAFIEFMINQGAGRVDVDVDVAGWRLKLNSQTVAVNGQNFPKPGY
ncbi:hypothetical protein E2C01_003334 [Portunus trituberculatus]|uniref:Uncharacterized protein n=1 Tax=Portunus trituberculatus TaxID=210409 RepID=A0A5B7CPX0_PORTR|nr:hypothetical protein [Portunus trituberculatus]